MTETQIRRATRVRAAEGRAFKASGKASWSHRARLRLWTLLNAQALLNGETGAAFAEDDRMRLAARRANSHS
jgi:hypothetical protein